MKRFLIPVILSVLWASTAWAEITYVDANPDANDGPVNVTVQGAPVQHGVNFLLNTAGESDADSVWQERPRVGLQNGDSVLVSVAANDAADDGNGILWTSTPTLPAGTYDVFLFFWNNANDWDCQAAIGELDNMTGMTVYSKANATDLSVNAQIDGYDLPATLRKSEGTQRLFGVNIGQAVLESDGQITVSTAGIHRAGFSDQRTWYDGIGYQLVQPCASIPDVTVEGPIIPGETSVTISEIDPAAESVNVYRNGSLLASSVGSPPATPASMVLNVSALSLNDVISARQVIGGVERCGPASEVVVSFPPRLPHITYVDAVANTDGSNGNTTIDEALVDFTAGTGNATTGTGTGVGNDGLWHYRTGFANGGQIFEGNDENPALAPLVTTLTLEPGTYELYGVFWVNANGAGAWDASFQVGSTGLLVDYAGGNVITTTVDGSEFVNPVLTREGDRHLVVAPLGEYTVSGPIEIRVGAPNRNNAEERTWYDGLGYKLVSPSAPLQAFDGFGDGDRDNDGVLDDPDGSGSGVVDDAADVGLEWRRVLATCCDFPPPAHELRIAPDLPAPAGLGDDNAMHVTVTEPQAIQVATFQDTALQNSGDFIRLTFSIRLSAVVNFGDTFRFGLFHNNATTSPLDQPTSDVYDDDLGYVAAMATGVDSGESHLARGLAYGNLGSLLGEDELYVPEDPFDEVINDTNPHTLSMEVVRGATGAMVIIVSMDGVEATRFIDTTRPLRVFNEVAFGTTPVQSISYIIDDVLVESGTGATVCETISSGTVEPILPPGQTTVNVSGILPFAESVNVYSGTTLIGTAAGNPPSTPSTVAVTVPPLVLDDLITARQVVDGVEGCAAAVEVKVGDCAAVRSVSLVDGVRAKSTSVTVSGVTAEATSVAVYLEGTTLIGTAPADGTTVAQVTVPSLVAGDRIMATQIVNGVESCMLTPGAQVLGTKIVYVDATPNTNGTDGNTTFDGALIDFTAGTGNATTSGGQPNAAQSSDNLWHLRVRPTVNGGNIWSTDVPGEENTPPLVTTLNLPAGTYELYGMFWNAANNTSAWDIEFRVGPTGEFTRFSKANGTPTTMAGIEFTSPTATRDGVNAQVMVIAPLGTFEVNGPVEIYANGSLDITNTRTWFDGVGYALPCSDPSADVDGDGDVDAADFAILQRCLTVGTEAPVALVGACQCLDHDQNGSIDALDIEAFIDCGSGPSVPADPTCDD